MNLKKLMMMSTGLLFAAGAGTAFADDTEAGAAADATVQTPAGGASAGMEATATTGGTAFAEGMWSPQLIMNPQTMPKAGIGIGASFEILRLNFPAVPPAMSSTVTAEFLSLAAAYGVSDKLTVGATYAVDIHDPGGSFPSDGRAKGPLGLYGAFNIMHKDKLSVTAGADFEINVGNTDDKSINAGLSAKYLVAPKIAVFTGNPVPIGPAGQHLSISLASNGPIDFRVPVGVALQATPELFAYVDTTLLNIGISNSANAFIFSDFIPVDIGALYRATPDLDVGVTFADDLKAAGDAYIIGLTARFYKQDRKSVV